MKRSPHSKRIKQALLAVPAAALMLGAAQAQTSIGINFTGGYAPNYTGYAGYYSGFPVTSTAFGLSAAKWYTTTGTSAGVPYNYAASGSMTVGAASSITVNWSAANVWGSIIGLDAGYTNAAGQSVTTPGNDQVLWGYLDDTGSGNSVSISGLASVFTNGYAIQTIGSDYYPVTFENSTVTDGVTTNSLATAVLWRPNAGIAGQVVPASAGISLPSGTFTSDSITVSGGVRAAGRAPLCGFIISDVPVLTYASSSTAVAVTGGSFILPAPSVVGIGLTYQWQHNGTNIPGAVFATYTNVSVASGDGGSYQPVVSSTFFPSTVVTGAVDTVSVVPPHAARTATFDANTSVTGAQDGSGTWGYTLTNFWSGTFDDYWGNADTAVFGAGGTSTNTVTLTASVIANAITFNSGYYTITNTAGESVSLAGSAVITATANGAIAAPLSIATNTFVKAGSGYLTISGALTSTNTFVSAGTLEVLSRTSDLPYVVTNGAKLKIGYSTSGGYANTGMKIYGDGTSATTGLYLKGGSSYSVSGTPTLLGAPTTIRQYGTGLAAFNIFDINSTGLYCTAAASGSIIDSNIQYLNGGYGMALQVDPGTNTVTGDLILNGPLNIDAHNGVYGLVKKGSGSLKLNAVATTTNCGVELKAGSLICGISNSIGVNGTLTTSTGTTVYLNTTSQTISNATLAGTLVMNINKGGTPSSALLAVTNGGALTYGGSLVVTNVGGTLALGDTFTLFSSSGGFGSPFTTVTLPVLSNGLGWQNNISVDGTLTVVPGSVPPSITSDLSGGTNYTFVGGGTIFTVVAAGDPTLHYQWFKNGVTPLGPNSPTLALSNLTSANAGYYSVVVTNNYGSISSQTNYLAVLTPDKAAAAIVGDSPLSFWPFNETQFPTAYDYMGLNNGAMNGGIIPGSAGPVPPTYAGFSPSTVSFIFDGTAYVDCDTKSSLSGTTDFTVEAWLNTGANNNNGGVIIEQRYASGYNGEYEFTVTTNGTLSFLIYGAGNYQVYGGLTSSTNTTLVNDGNWHHVAAVRSGTNQIIYVDGRPVASASGPVAPLDPTFTVSIGYDARSQANYFEGYMCDVAIYSHALAPAQVASHASSGFSGLPFGLTLNNKTLTWGSGTLLSSPVLGPSAVWTPVSGATSPYALPHTGVTNASVFYRLKY